MAHFDGPTEKFMTDVGGKAPPAPSLDALKAVRTAVKVVENPRTAIPKLITKAIVKSLQKEAGEPSAFAGVMTFLGALNSLHGQAWWDWEPETLWIALGETHKLEPTERVRNIVMGLQTVMSTDAPFEHWHVFEKTGLALVGEPVDFQVVQPLEPDLVSLTWKVLSAIRPHNQYEMEVMSYMAACCNAAGMVYLPPDLYPPAANLELERMTHDRALALTVKDLWETGADGASDAVKHQLAMLREVREFSRNG